MIPEPLPVATAACAVLLYGWWPVRAEARLYDRLGEIDVRVLAAGAAGTPAP